MKKGRQSKSNTKVKRKEITANQSAKTKPGLSLGEGRPVFSLWTRNDLTDEWQADAGSYIAVELPDSPWGRAYYHWAISQLSQLGENTNFLPVMLASMADFRGLPEPERQVATGNCLQSLLETGKPPKHFARIMRQVPLQ